MTTPVMTFALLALVLLLVGSSSASAFTPSSRFVSSFAGATGNAGRHDLTPANSRQPNEQLNPQTRQGKETLLVANLFVGPQIAFVATIVGVIVAYIAGNIDSIKAQQKIATDAAISKQNSDVSAAQSSQQAAIAKAKEQQAQALANAKRVADEARVRADALKPKK